MLHLISFFLIFLAPLLASFNSGGGSSESLSYTNHASIGAPFAPIKGEGNDFKNLYGFIELVALGTNSEEVDSDGDGMPDNWEISYGLNKDLDNAEADTDGDGRTDFFEYITGSDPTDSQAHFIVAGTVSESNIYSIQYESVSGRNYTIKVSPNLDDWHTWKTESGNDTTHTFAFNPDTVNISELNRTSEKYFFKIEIQIAD